MKRIKRDREDYERESQRDESNLDRETKGQTEIDGQTDTETNKQTDTETERQSDKQTQTQRLHEDRQRQI